MENINEKIPLYYKVAEDIEDRIDNGDYKVGSLIPSERELCNIYNVSRMTIRLAIDELVRDGKVKKYQGKGTYVCNRSIQQNLNNVYSFSKEMEKQGKISSTKVIEKEIIFADQKLARHLEIQIGNKVIFLERLRCEDQTPVMVEKTWFNYEPYQFLMKIDFNKKGLYKTLQEDYGVVIDHATEKFRATQLNAMECSFLNCPKNQYGLLVKRISYAKDQIVSYSTIVSKGDLFEFTIQLS